MTAATSLKSRNRLSDTITHSAITALSVTSSVVDDEDPLRAQAASTIYPLIFDSVAGDGGPARRRAGAITTLVDAAVGHPAPESNPQLIRLTLALEQWLLHPGRYTRGRLNDAARILVQNCSDEDLLVSAWLVGVGMETALDLLRRGDLNSAETETARSLVGAACESCVPMTWAARQLGIPRNGLYRAVRSADPQAWRTLLR